MCHNKLSYNGKGKQFNKIWDFKCENAVCINE